VSLPPIEIAAALVGARCRPLSVSLSPRRTMNYAAGLDDDNPHYFDDTRAEGLFAPPMIAVALTWPLSADLDDAWGDSGIPIEARMRQVHYNESLVWHRPMRTDEHLEISGELCALMPHAAGTLATLRYEARDQNGSPAFTEYITGLLRGVVLSGKGRGSVDVPQISEAPAGLDGDWETPIEIAPLAAHRYDAGSEISFPIHTSPAFARQVGLPDAIYHGTATLGLAIRALLNREGGTDPRRLAEVHAGFRGMVFPGTTVNLVVAGSQLERGLKTVYFGVKTATGEWAIRHGRAVFNWTQ